MDFHTDYYRVYACWNSTINVWNYYPAEQISRQVIMAIQYALWLEK